MGSSVLVCVCACVCAVSPHVLLVCVCVPGKHLLWFHPGQYQLYCIYFSLSNHISPFSWYLSLSLFISFPHFSTKYRGETLVLFLFS